MDRPPLPLGIVSERDNTIDCVTEYFKKMFMAHSAVKYMKESIDQLYTSASYISPSFDSIPKTQSNPKRLENTIVKIVDLKMDCENLLNERADFDRFVFGLTDVERNVLIMRCEKNMSWKEIAFQLNISVASVERIYRKVCLQAENELFKSNSINLIY